MLNPGMFSSNKEDWETPWNLFSELNEEFHFTVDVCANEHNKKLEHYFSPEQDGLKQDWSKEIAWMNPPYSEPETPCKNGCKKKRCRTRGYHIHERIPGQIDWVRKAYEESQKGATVVCLLPARTDTVLFHKYCSKGEVRFIKGRLKFVGGKTTAPFPSMIVIFRPPQKWTRV